MRYLANDAKGGNVWGNRKPFICVCVCHASHLFVLVFCRLLLWLLLSLLLFTLADMVDLCLPV